MLYDYKCEACGLEHEVEHPMRDASHSLCPVCHNPDTYGKVISPSTVMFIGDGWETNHASGRYHPKGGT